jgi:hypothetical protein
LEEEGEGRGEVVEEEEEGDPLQSCFTEVSTGLVLKIPSDDDVSTRISLAGSLEFSVEHSLGCSVECEIESSEEFSEEFSKEHSLE